MKHLKEFFEKRPLILALLIFVFIIWLFWWLEQPIEIIYTEDAKPGYWIGRDPEGFNRVIDY